MYLSDLSQAHPVSAQSRPVRLNYLLRDSNQSLVGGRVPVETNVERTKLAVKAGFSGVEIWGGTQLEVPVRFKGEHPFEQGLKPLSEAAQGVDRMMLMRGQAGNGRRIFSDEAIKLEMEVMTRDDQITLIRAFDATNNLQNLETVLSTKKELQAQGRNVRVQVAMSYAPSQQARDDKLGKTYRDPQFYVELADTYRAAGADEICFKDMAGIMRPEDAEYMVRAIKAKHPDVPLTLHMHATGGQAQATMLSAIKAGIDSLDVAVDGMSDWVGQPSVQDILWLMEHSDDPEIKNRMPEMDGQALAELTDLELETRARHAPYELAYDAGIQKAIVKAGLPGGMATTLLNNIKELYQNKADEKTIKKALEGTLAEIPRVTVDLGHLEKVTPTSDIVAKQALLNWFYNEQGENPQRFGRKPYKVFGPGFSDYVLGKNGYSQNPPRESVIAMVEERTRQKRYEGRPADRVDPQEVQAVRQTLSDAGLNSHNDEDVLTALMAGDDLVGPAFLSAYRGNQEMSGVKTYKPPLEKPALFWKNASLGVMAEDLVQKTQKLQMIHDGASFVGVKDTVKEKYIEGLEQDIKAIACEMAGSLEKLRNNLTHAFEGAQLAHEVEAYVKQRTCALGIRGHYAPNLSLKGKSVTMATSDLTGEISLEQA